VHDPFTARDRGTRRVRAVTAWVAAGTVVGTGAVALSVAATERDAAAAVARNSVVQNGGVQNGGVQNGGVQNGGGQNGVVQGPTGDDEDSGGFTPPRSLPGSGHTSSRGHASSGGS
jgi:hypothetical protein